jgi:hypothetical protein
MAEIQIDKLPLQERKRISNKKRYEEKFEEISKQKQEYYIANKERINERAKQRYLEKNGGRKQRGRPRKIINKEEDAPQERLHARDEDAPQERLPEQVSTT